MRLNTRRLIGLVLTLALLMPAVPMLAQGGPQNPGLTSIDRRLIRYVLCPVTNAQMLTLGTTPVTCIQAQGAGTIIEVVSGVLFFQFNTAYTAGSDMRLYYANRNSGTAASGTITESGILSSVAANSMFAFPGFASLSATPGTVDDTNKAIVFQGITGATFTGGAAANKVFIGIAYRVLNRGF